MIIVRHLAARAENNGLKPSQVAPLTTLIILLLLGMILAGALMVIRGMRRASCQAQADAQLPLYKKSHAGHRRLTITAMPYKRRDSLLVDSEKQSPTSTLARSPVSPVPEIRITFPDEMDESGKRQSGRVVVVRVGEHSVGLEPYMDDLPPYERDAMGRFDSLDLDCIGGLKEKDSKDFQ